MSETEKALSFEERMQQVQELTSRIENGTLSLEDSVKEYERGMRILMSLTAELDGMARRLTVLQDGNETEVSHENIQ